MIRDCETPRSGPTRELTREANS